MRWPHPGFTVRRLVVAVGIVGLLLGGLHDLLVRDRALQYRARAEEAARMELRCRWIAAIDPAIRARKAKADPKNPLFNDPAHNRRMIGWFAAMKAKYQLAADHPRLPVPPDPPRP